MIRSPTIDALRAANWTKAHGAGALPATVLRDFEASGLFLDTCLRQLCIATQPLEPSPGVELRRGSEAYRFALEVITGLRSAVPGETNVFGQFKKAWHHCRASGQPDVVARIAPWVHRLINDARVIRHNHLHGIGGASYGSLVRRMIAPSRGDRVLFVGAGDLARSILPYFGACDVGIWNHRCTDLTDFATSRRFPPELAGEAAAWADHVVFTTPPDRRHDSAWQSRLRDSRIRTLVHLGHRGGELASWPGRAKTRDLDDLFELRRRQADIRTDRLERARRACRDAARATAEERRAALAARLAPA